MSMHWHMEQPERDSGSLWHRTPYLPRHARTVKGRRSRPPSGASAGGLELADQLPVTYRASSYDMPWSYR